ncbi:MAG: Transcriptional regulator, TetR family [Myxococcaceae bacterium]|nr:Transcriptional regulator, TetR family [Myxococcaceae bacterium]
MARTTAREKILEAGLEVMHSQGFNGCSVQDITKYAGVPKGSFYAYFPSKEALAVEVLVAYKGFGDPDVLLEGSEPALERLRAYFEQAARQFKASGFQRGCLLGNFGSELSDASELVRKALAQRFQNWHRVIADVLREGQERGNVSKLLNADQVARFLVGAWEGALMQMKVSRSEQPIEDFLKLALAPLRVS